MFYLNDNIFSLEKLMKFSIILFHTLISNYFYKNLLSYNIKPELIYRFCYFNNFNYRFFLEIIKNNVFLYKFYDFYMIKKSENINLLFIEE